MPDWLHRTDVELLLSIPEAELPEAAANYIEDPDLSAVTGQPRRYWKVAGDTVSLATAGEQTAIDAALLEAARDARSNELDELEAILRAFAMVLLDEFNVLRAQHSLADRTISQLKTAVRNKLGS